MNSPFSFLRSHTYEALVTGLVLALGVCSHLLRTGEPQAEAVSAAIPPAPLSAAPSPAPTAIPERTWLRPASGGVLTAYSDSLPQWSADMDCWQMHTGVDLAAALDEPIRAIADGTVLAVADDPLLGLTVSIDHGDGHTALYSSLAAAHCAPGDLLREGESVGAAGNSADSEALLGCHLHLEILQNGLPVKPMFRP